MIRLRPGGGTSFFTTVAESLARVTLYTAPRKILGAICLALRHQPSHWGLASKKYDATKAYDLEEEGDHSR